jgi:predicted ATPase/class 3 adenylate cyclase
VAEQPQGTVTMLFTDIEGSTKLLQRAGDTYGDLLDAHRRLLRSAFEEHGGYEVDSEGDAFFVAFSSAEEAVGAAADGQQALAGYPWPDGNEIRVRIGIHMGEPRLIERKYVGLDVHRAARVMAAGHGGQVLLSHITRQQLAEDAPLLDLGEHRLKDLLQPERLWQLQVEGMPREFPALKTLGNRPTNLPIQPNALIGRGQEIAEVTALLRDADVRLMTLTGTGGTGKTRLALQVAAELLDDFASGVFFVSLAPIRDPALLIPTVMQTLAVRAVPGEALAATLAEYLEQKEMLLVLDNFEQLIDAAGDTSSLLSDCQSLKLLVTSRERLRVAAEQVYAVPPLALPVTDDSAELAENESVGLFVARARAAVGDFDFDGNQVAVAGICRAVDGLPLAIELAAARVATLPPQALLDRLSRRLRVLTTGLRDVEERHRTLRSTIGWSYDLLTEDEKELFRSLSVFVDGCRLEGGVAVTAAAVDEFDVLPVVESLVEKSLLRQRLDVAGEPRYWMLETIREYGLERLAEAAADSKVRGLHADYVLTLARTAAPELVGPDQRAWFQRLDAEFANIRAAFDFLLQSGEIYYALELLHATGLYWESRGRLREGLALLGRALEAGGDAPAAVRARSLYTAARLADAEGELHRARSFVEQAIALAREAKDDWVLAFGLSMLGVLVGHESAAAGRPLLEEALAVARRSGDKETLAGVLNNLGVIAVESGDLDQAIRHCHDALELRRELRHTRQIANSLHNLGFLLMRQGQYGEARPLLRESFELATMLGDNIYAAGALVELGWCAFFEDDLEDAETTFLETLRLCHEVGSRRGVCEAVIGLAGVVFRRGDRTRGSEIIEIVAPLEPDYFGGTSMIRDYIREEVREAGIVLARHGEKAKHNPAALDELAKEILEQWPSERDTPAVNARS